MVDQNKTDLVMKFTLDRQPVWAECALDIPDEDKLMEDFTKNADYDCYTNYFEVNSFDFGISLKESDDTSGNGQPANRHAAGIPAPPVAGAFARWRSATETELRTMKRYPLEFDKFSFSRNIDSASPLFFQQMCKKKTFDSAALVKRLSQGEQNDRSRPSLGYMRIDFKEVLITGLDWDDGDFVKEKCEFICKYMKITYLSQLQDGTIGKGARSSAEWPNSNDDRSLGIRFAGRNG